MKALLLEQGERFKKQCVAFHEDQTLQRIAYNQGRAEGVNMFIKHCEDIVREMERKDE